MRLDCPVMGPCLNSLGPAFRLPTFTVGSLWEPNGWRKDNLIVLGIWTYLRHTCKELYHPVALYLLISQGAAGSPFDQLVRHSPGVR